MAGPMGVAVVLLLAHGVPARDHELVPGVVVQDLERHRVRYVVLRADPGYVPSLGGARTLDGFIEEKFARVETFGNYSVWRRREERS